MKLSSAGNPLADAAERLRQLHVPGQPVIVANCWDCASAAALEEGGVAVLGTTSRGIATTLGVPDGEVVPIERVLDIIGRITAASTVPVTADLETGFGLSPDELVERLLTAGAVGLNIEDTDIRGDGGLVDVDEQANRIAGLRRAGTAAGVHVVINARTDVLMDASSPRGRQLAEIVTRARAYRDAGADCIYPIGRVDEDLVAQICEAVAGPVNVVHWPGSPPLRRLAELGVARVSVAAVLLTQTMRHLTDLGRRLARGEDIVPIAT